jgi:hypothetical protein
MRPEYRYVSNLTFEFTHMGRAPKGGAHGATFRPVDCLS